MQNLCRNVEDEVTVVHKNDVTPEKMYQLILARSQACVIAPSRTGSEPVPVVIFFHGAGHVDSGVQNQLQKLVNDYHFILLAPYSAMDSWDLLRGGWGEDARAVRRYLAWLREHYSVDERRISMMGFSDGASYALTLGGRSKDISGIAAFSPGFCLGNITARRVFISHAENDAVLPYSVAQ
ncbi:hypothetical protein QMZ20_08995, partial [Serratia bockelmannii]|nr:hypothetical protein [Serratia bockelmannii]